MFPNRSNEPHLRHAHDGAEHAEAECDDGGNSGWEEIGSVPDGDIVFTLFVDKMFGKSNALVDGQPVALKRQTWSEMTALLGEVDNSLRSTT